MKTMRLLVIGLLYYALAFATPIPNSLSPEYEKLLEDPAPLYEQPPTDLELFLDALGWQESGNRYHITNRYGYMGRYQFGRATLRALGYDVTRSEFLSSPELQEEAMLKLLTHNKDNMQYYISRYAGKKVHGVHVTESGMLAAAHLVGPGRVKEFLRSGHITRDGNNVPLTSYMRMFAGYDIGSLLFVEDSDSFAAVAP